MGFLGKVSSRLRRDAGVGIERTFLYRRSPDDLVGAVESSLSLVMAPVAPEDINTLSSLGPDDRLDWQQRLSRGDECYGAWVGSVLVHYSWVQTTGAHEITAAGMSVQVRSGDVWIYNCCTSDAYRGQRIYPRTLAHIVREKFAAGATTAWIYAAEHNLASQRGIDRAGFVRVETLRALRVGRRYRTLAAAS